MGFFSVMTTFVMNTIFGIILPLFDVGSDTYLVHKTMNFNLGTSSQLAGCRSCYGKTEDEVYQIRVDGCMTCIYDNWIDIQLEYNPIYNSNRYIPTDYTTMYLDYNHSPMYGEGGGLNCGEYTPMIDKLIDLQNDRKCKNTKTWHHSSLLNNATLELGECASGDGCCIERKKYTNRIDDFQNSDPKVNWFMCHQYPTDEQLCFGSGASDIRYCLRYSKKTNFVQEVFNKIFYLRNLFNTHDDILYFKLESTQTKEGKINHAEFVIGDCKFEDKCCVI